MATIIGNKDEPTEVSKKPGGLGAGGAGEGGGEGEGRVGGGEEGGGDGFGGGKGGKFGEGGLRGGKHDPVNALSTTFCASTMSSPPTSEFVTYTSFIVPL